MHPEPSEKKELIRIGRLADDINAKCREAVQLAGESVRSGNAAVVAAIEAGRLLSRAKDIVGHGKWLKWLADSCPDIDHETARKWMLLSKSTHKWNLEDCRSVRQAYIKVGIIPEPVKVDNGIGTADVFIDQQFFERIDRLSSMLGGVSFEDASPETKIALKTRLEPWVAMYQSL